MPGKRYVYPCGHGYVFATTCNTCGAPGTFDGWEGFMHDRMAAFARTRGLKPMGPHKKLTDELFAGAFRGCEACRGRGYVAVDSDHCRPCDRCDSNGVVPARPLEAIAALRARVLEAFPDAGHGPVPVEGPFILDVAANEMLSAAAPPHPKGARARTATRSRRA